MRSSSRKGLEVFDFKEEDEIVESKSGRFMGKFRNPKADSSPITKYEFLECFAKGTNAQRMDINDVLCVDVDANDSDHECNDRGLYALGTSEGYCAIKEGVSGLDGNVVSNSSYEHHAHINSDNLEPGDLVSGCLRVDFLAVGASSLEVASAGNKQSNCTLPGLPSDNDPVDVISDEDKSVKESSPSTSDFGEDEGSSEDSASNHCSDGWEMENINMTVVVSPDYLIHEERYCTESLLTFSSSCIKLEGSNAYGSKESFISGWAIDDVADIESQWYGKVETALVKLSVRPTAAMEAENPHGASGIVELKFAVCDPRWSEKQGRIMSLDTRYKAMWKVVLDTEVAREEDDFVGQNSIFSSMRYFSNFDEPFEDVVYPKGDPDAVSVSKRDVELLQPETFINDTIIDFYVKYLKNKIQPEDRHRFHFFNSFFFRKLADLDKDPSSASEGRAAFQRVRKWTRKVNLFEKDFIFIPVNFNLHWSLIVICHPGEVANFEDEEMDKSCKVPCILHMDSIKGSHKGLKNLVQSYLWEEWKERQTESSEDVSSKFFNLRFVPLELPQQENSFDCGLFLLHYVELFLEDAPVNFSPFKITKYSNFLNVDWFPPAEASLKRALIQKLIYELLEDHSQKIPPVASNDEHLSSGFPENDNEKENGVEFLSNRCSPAKSCHGNSSCSTANQGIEIKLLAPSPVCGAQYVRDHGLVFRELFEPGTTAGSFPNGQYRPFGQVAPFHKIKGAMSPIEEDAETGEQFEYSPSGTAGCRPLAGVTSEACTTSYSSKDFGLLEPLWNPGFSVQQEEHDEGDSSPRTSSFGSQNSSELGIDEHPPVRDFVCPNQQEKTEEPRSVSPENIGCITESPASASSERVETCIVEDSQEVDRTTESNQCKGTLSCQENPPALFHEEANSAEDGNLLCDNVQVSVDDSASESDEQQAAKRPRLMPPHGVERRRTRRAAKDCPF